MKTWSSIYSSTCFMEIYKSKSDLCSLLTVIAKRSIAPGIAATATDLQGFTHMPDAELASVSVDEVKSYFNSLAK